MKQMALLGLLMVFWLAACAAATNNEPVSSNSDKLVITVYKSPT